MEPKIIPLLPYSERPRERCLENGAQALSLRECLALILNSGPPGVGSLGLASAILSRPGEGLAEREQERAFFTAMEVSARAHLSELPGLGEAACARLLASFELGRRYAVFRTAQTRSSRKRDPDELRREAASRIPTAFRLCAEEWLGFVPLYRNGRPGEFCLVERGVRTHVNIEPSELFARILALRPSGFFVFHNHPSGEPTASDQDFELTYRVHEISRKLGVRFIDHGIVLPGDRLSPRQSDVNWIGVI